MVKSDYDEANILEGKLGDFSFKTHERFRKYYFNKDTAFENQSTHHIETLLHKGDTFIDVGAHHGYYSLVASEKVGPEGKVYAFEPVPENRALLEDNLAQLPPKLCTVYDYAVSEKRGKAEFNIPWASDSAGLFKHPLADTLRTIKVELRSLDELFKDQRVDLVKIDTEGNELQVLRGMKRVIKNNPNIKLLLEFNPMCLQSAQTGPLVLLQEITQLGFDIYIVDEENSATLKLADINRWQEYLVAVNYRNLLCVRQATPSVLLFSHGADLQGAEMATVELAAALQDRGSVATVSLPAEGPLQEYCRALGVATTRHRPDWWIGQPTIAATGTQLETEQLLQHYDYDTVLCSTVANPVPPLCAKRLQKNVVWYLHEDLTRFTYPYPQTDVGSYIDEMADELLVSSKHLKAKLQHPLPVFKRAKILYPLPPQPAVLPGRKAMNAPLVMIGKIEPNKNQLEALQALIELKTHNLKPQLLLIGAADKQYKKELQNFAAAHGLQKQLVFKGPVPEVPECLADAAALVSCSLNESFGRTLVEAMRVGTPVIASDNGGSAEVIDKEAGLIYKSGDYKALASHLKRVLKDDTQTLVAQGHERAHELDRHYQKQLSSLQEHLHEVSVQSKSRVIDRINTTYLEELAADRLRYEQELEAKASLQQAYDKLAAEHVALIDAHRSVIDSRAWQYTTKARRVLQPVTKVARRRRTSE